MTKTKRPRKNKMVTTILDYITIKAEHERRCFNNDLKRAIKRDQEDGPVLKHSEIIEIVNRYPLHRAKLLYAPEIDSDMKRRIMLSMTDPTYDPDNDDVDDDEPIN